MNQKLTERWLRSPRGRVVYWISKADHPAALCLVFLHGLTADHTLFERQLSDFAGRYTVLVWDAPLHGHSRPYGDFSYPNCAEDLKAILDQEGIERCVLAGQSMGGYVIQAFLLRWPERAMGFIGIDTCPYGTAYYSKSDQWWLRQVGWMSRLFPRKLLAESIARSCAKTEYGYQNMKKALSVYSKRELCRLLDVGYKRFLEINQDMEISCPVLILVGESDRTGKVRKYCQMWWEKEGYPLRVIPNAAHNSNVDNPDAVDREIEMFLERLGTP